MKKKKSIVKSTDLHFSYNVIETTLIQTLVGSRHLMQMILISSLIRYDSDNVKKTPNNINRNKNESLQVQVRLLHAILLINKIQEPLIAFPFSTHYHMSCLLKS